MKDECRLLIKTVVFIEHNVKEIPVHGLYFTIHGRNSHFCMGQAQSIQCAVTQHSRAVGCYHTCTALTNTHMVNPSIKTSVGYPVGSVKKIGSLASRTNHWRRMSVVVVLVGCLLLYLLLFKVRRLCLTLQCHAELRVDHQTVAHWSQFCRKAMSYFILSCSL